MIPPIGPVTTTSTVYPHVHSMSSRMSTVIDTNASHTKPWKNPTTAFTASLGDTTQK